MIDAKVVGAGISIPLSNMREAVRLRETLPINVDVAGARMLNTTSNVREAVGVCQISPDDY